MIFDRNIRLRGFYDDFITHGVILILISSNLLGTNIIDFTLLACVFIYLSKGKQIHWFFPSSLFLWGIYADLLTGYPVGYSGSLFLFFLILNQTSKYFGIFELNNIRFFIFLIGLLLLFICEQSIIYLTFYINISILTQFLKILLILALYFPFDFFMSNRINSYVSKK